MDDRSRQDHQEADIQRPHAPKRKRPGRRADVTREDWVEVGLSELGARGPGALRLDALCRKLGITKGSFYWYFSGRAEFMQLLLEAWEKRDTLALIDHVEQRGGTPLQKLHELFSAANSGRVDFRIEQAIRHWGHSEEAIRRMLHRVDRKRIEYVMTLFSAISPDGGAANTQTALLYSLIFGEAMIYRREAPKERAERRERTFWSIIALSDLDPGEMARVREAACT